MRTRGILVAVAVLAIGAWLLTLACAPQATPTPTTPATPTPAARPTPAPATPTPAPQAPEARPTPARPAWEAAWEKTIELGKKEGKVIIYANLGKEITTSLRKDFKDRYGMEVEFTTGRGADIAGKILSERRGGLYLVDLFIAGAPNCLTQLKTGGATIPLRPALLLPEVTEPKLWFEGRLTFVDKDEHVFSYRADTQPDFVVNTNLVKEGEITSYKDLLNPKWKGKIVMNDPTVSGKGQSTFRIVYKYVYGSDYWKEFVRQEPMITRDQRLPVEWVARGKYAIAVAGKLDVIEEFRKAGAPIAYVDPSDAGYLSTGSQNLVLLDKAPHPNAAKVFINWLLSKEGQGLASRVEGFQSTREDVPTDHLLSIQKRNPAVKYFDNRSEEAVSEKDKYSKLAQEIFTPLL